MVHLSEESYAEFKSICDKEGIHYDTEAEYREAAQNLLSLFEVLYDGASEELARKKRLATEPNGYAIDSNGRTCFVCHRNVQGEIWYDKWGMKCMNCQAAFKRKIFPGYVLKDRDNNRHVTDSQLGWKYGLHSQTIKKLIREGRLKPRVIPNGPMIFLRKENPDLPQIIEELTNAKSHKNKR
ncbi:MAG TPA: hypothetical protein PL051_01285 [Candidatus Saccharibacteria bacterium]|nr:hypothetical protein [Candidatus Saccharibacteria bacterium]